MKIKIKEEFKDDWITREAGETLRKRLVTIISQKTNLVLDFEGLTVASTSFFDEGFAKLAQEGIAAVDFEKYVSLIHMHPRDRQLMIALCQKRGFTIVR